MKYLTDSDPKHVFNSMKIKAFIQQYKDKRFRGLLVCHISGSAQPQAFYGLLPDDNNIRREQKLLLVKPSEKHFNEMLIRIQIISIKEKHMKIVTLSTIYKYASIDLTLLVPKVDYSGTK